MRLYLYAIAEGLGSVGDVTGIQREPLNVIPIGNALIVAGSVSELPEVSRDHLIAQDSVVRALHARADALLPMRFGSSVENIESLTRLLDPLATRVADTFALVRGREQMTVRVLRTLAGAARCRGCRGCLGAGAEGAKGARSATGIEGAGTRYLMGRASSRTPPEVTSILGALNDLQRATRIESGRDPAVVATVYQLIDRGASALYCRRVEEAAALMPDLALRVSGPSPPYAFAVLTAP